MTVLLVNMPFSQLRWPNLGLSLLKGSLASQGISCDLRNFGFQLAERVGYELYDWIAGHFAFVLGGEYLFARNYFGDRVPDTDRFWNEILLHTEPELDNRDRKDFETVAEAVDGFLDDCVGALDWTKYRIVGFTTSYQQTLASLCLARRIRRLCPDIRIVFGGAACEGDMGRELLRRFDEIDFIFLGEADLSFPKVVRNILNGTVDTSPLPDGVLSRTASILPKFDSVCPTGLQVPDLDRLPPPDFDDYFDDLDASSFRGKIRPLLFFETSRGCWWGERRQCAFCGLNGHSLRFRRKSPEKAVSELAELVRRYGLREACFADNIFAKDYFDGFLPKLKESGLDLRFEFEMKANQKKEHVRKLVDAGLAAAQLGIETFSTPILKMLSKGATARHNLQVLKWYTEAGVEVKWNILYGFPGEDRKEYGKLAELLPLVYHFYPPLAIGRVRVDRFAPYHNEPEKFGIVRLRPFRGFQFLYPFGEDSLRRLSYYHEFDFADGRDIDDYAGGFLDKAKAWEEEFHRGTLRAFDREDGVLLLTDTRTVATEFQYRLSGIERELYLFCDTASTRREIEARFPDSDSESLDKILSRWIDSRIMIRVDGRFFTLALNRDPFLPR